MGRAFGKRTRVKPVSNYERMPKVKREYTEDDPLNSPAFDSLRQYLLKHRSESVVDGEFEEHENELRRLISACETELLCEDLSRYDVDEKYITVDGVRCRRALRAAQNYTGQSGSLRVERSLYQPVGGGKTVCPLELRAGIVEGAWTPKAARIMAVMVTEVAPSQAAEIIGEFGGMTPSASSLDRLPKLLSERWEDHRVEWEEELRSDESIPVDAVVVAVSLDGVHVPLKKKELEGEAKNGSGYREASCGTISYFDKEGNRLSTKRFARMPETKKRTLKSELEAEFQWAVSQRPDLTVVKIADGAPDNWEFLSDLGEGGIEILDFYHAATHLKTAADAVHGAETVEARALFEFWKTTLKEDPQGAEKVLRALRYRRDGATGKERKTLTTELGYFRSMLSGMEYLAYADAHLPIGSGIVEAACKTLVTQRLKRSGMRWSLRGGQAILTLRALSQSERFDRAWRILGDSYVADVREAA